jgi:N-acylneuraminate cytidylyltransferase
MKNTIAIIPARAGSKSIPNKNLSKVGNASLLNRAIKLAIDSEISKIYVSTDSSEIASVARRAGAEIVLRPKELSTDIASTESAVIHALNYISFDEETSVALIQATSPFTMPTDLKNAMEFTSAGISVFSAVPFHSFLWEKLLDKWVPINHKKDLRVMKEFMNPTVVETGNFYCFNARDFSIEKSRFCKESMPYLINPISFLQIDSLEDLEFANKINQIFI